jgi:hypothetical protein
MQRLDESTQHGNPQPGHAPSLVSMDGDLIRRAILCELALPANAPLQIDSHGARLTDATVEVASIVVAGFSGHLGRTGEE